MFRRLHIQLTLFCTFITGLILVLMVCVCLLISESGLRQQSRASFSSSLSSLYQELEDDNTLSLEWLSQISHNYGIFLRLTDHGVPLFYQQFSGAADSSELFDAASAIAASQYGIDPGSVSRPSGGLTHAEFPVKAAPQNVSENLTDPAEQNNPPRRREKIVSALQSRLAAGADAWASAALISKSTGVLGVVVLQPLTALSSRIWRQRLFFGAACLAGLALLFMFSWHFTARMLAPIEENRRRQTQFIASASHELRSPLTVMLSCISAVRGGIAPDPDSYLGTVEAEGMRMSRLIGDMLTLANADNHSWHIHPAPIELDTLLLSVWESFETLARSRGFQWEIHLPDEPVPPCVCDRERIVQVLEILIDNAFSYVPKESLICLSLEYSSMFCICVSDNGPGIPDSQKQLVFDRFQRLDDSRKDKSHFGLGLSIAKEIISLHGGTLTPEDTPGGGATFRILLPGQKNRSENSSVSAAGKIRMNTDEI